MCEEVDVSNETATPAAPAEAEESDTEEASAVESDDVQSADRIARSLQLKDAVCFQFTCTALHLSSCWLPLESRACAFVWQSRRGFAAFIMLQGSRGTAGVPPERVGGEGSKGLP